MSTPSKWHDLRRFTDARVALGRVGNALPTAAHLDFQEAHARARDAVWSRLDVARLETELAPLGLPIQHVTSEAQERRRFLLRPDLGRRLPENTSLPQAPGSIALVVADGLCASGVQQQAPAVLRVLVPAFMISELRRGVEIGFLIVLPFLVIDLVVAVLTMSMGMMMLPPTVISLPFKVLFFVLIDGWHLLAGSLVNSFTFS